MTIPQRSTTVRVAVPIIDDARFEPSETFTLHLHDPSSNAVVGAYNQALTTIEDDDPEPFLGAVSNLAAVCVDGQITVSWDPSHSSHVQGLHLQDR